MRLQSKFLQEKIAEAAEDSEANNECWLADTTSSLAATASIHLDITKETSCLETAENQYCHLVALETNCHLVYLLWMVKNK